MKRFILGIAAVMMISDGFMAQAQSRGPRGSFPKRSHGYYGPSPRVHGGIYIGSGIYDNGYSYNMSDLLYAAYGSEYRRAKAARNSGIFLTTIVAPLSAAVACCGIEEGVPGVATLGIAGVLGGLGAGIPLWASGQRRIDSMWDDFASRNGYRPSLRLGTNRNGFGFSLNF